MIETNYNEDGSVSTTVVSGRRIQDQVTSQATNNTSKREIMASRVTDTVSQGNDSTELSLTNSQGILSVKSGNVETNIDITANQATIKSENPLSHDHYVAPTIPYHYAQKGYVDAPDDGKRYVRQGGDWVQAPFQDTQLKVQRMVGVISDTVTEILIPEHYTVPPTVMFNLLEGDHVNLIESKVDRVLFRGSGKVQVITLGI